MGSTTPYGLRYPEYAAGADPKLDLQKLAEDIAPRLHRAEPLTTAQIAAIASPRIGQLVMNTDTGRVQFWNGTIWRPVGGGASGKASVGPLTFPASISTFQAASFYIGLGLEDVTFVMNGGAAGGVQIAATTDASQAQFIGAPASASFTTQVLAAADATTTVSWSGIYATRNARITSDGYVRFEISSSTSASGVTFQVNWRAR